MKKMVIHSIAAAASAAVVISSITSAGYIPVYGGPTYTPGVGGFQTGPIAEHVPPYVGTNSAGTAFGTLGKYDASDVFKGERAVRWDGSGNAIELGNLGTGPDPFGSATGYTGTGASDINDAGTVVGTALKFDNNSPVFRKGSRAVRWDASGNAVELGTLGTGVSGVTESSALAINGAGTAVGNAVK
jgi:hypothetical protein